MAVYRGKYPLGGNAGGVVYSAWATKKYLRQRMWHKFRGWLFFLFGIPLPEIKIDESMVAPDLRSHEELEVK